MNVEGEYNKSQLRLAKEAEQKYYHCKGMPYEIQLEKWAKKSC